MRKMIKLTLLTFLATTAGAQLKAQTGDVYDLRIDGWSAYSPKACVLTEQPVTFTIVNDGLPIATGFHAGIIKDGKLLFEEKVDRPFKTDERKTITLNGKVDLAYEEEAKFKLYVRLDGDTNPQNDTLSYTVSMPKVIDYPYVWIKGKATENFKMDDWGLGWRYDEANDALLISGKGTNWMGSVVTDGIRFPKDRLVKCSFDYAADKDVRLLVRSDYGFRIDTLFNQVLSSSATDFVSRQFSFETPGSGVVDITASLEGDMFAYGSFMIRNICFGDAVKDVSTEKILSPSLKRVARDTEGLAVKARFANHSPFDVENPTFAYQVGGNKVEEVYKGLLEAGASVDYAFNKLLQLPAADKASIDVWCKAEGDGDSTNDTLTTDYILYDAMEFPYASNFDEANDLWDIFDANKDGNTWTFASLGASGGVATLPLVYYTNMDDYLIMPAVKIPAGKSRVSFYYSGMTRGGTEHLKVMMGTVPDLDEMNEVILDQDITNAGWLNGYHLFNLDKPAICYFAFHATGNNDQLYLDNIHVDREEDLCMDKVVFDTNSGYGKTTSKITLSYVNHGVSPQKNVTLRYYINQTDTPYAEETPTDTVNPGDTISYTFDKPADISVADSTYTLIGEIATPVGEDLANDKIVGMTISHWASQALPFFTDFTDNDRNVRWKAATYPDEGQSAWGVVESYQAYSSNNVLEHAVPVSEGIEDWAFSEAITMPKGKSEVSFFYRTRPYFDTPDFQQSFEVKMGKTSDRKSMTIDLAKFENVVVNGSQWKKFTGIVDIAEEGDYYLGFCNTSEGMSGSTSIDDISIKQVTGGKALPYKADFEMLDKEWNKCNNNKNGYEQYWNAFVEKDGANVLRVNRTADDAAYGTGTEGELFSPKLHLLANKTAQVSVDYALSSDSTNTVLNLYKGHVDNPDSLSLLASLPIVADSAYAISDYKFETGSADQDCYLALRVNTPKYVAECYGYVYDVRIKSVNVSYDDTQGIANIPGKFGAVISRRAHSLNIKSDSPLQSVDIFDLSGRKVQHVSSGLNEISIDCSGLKGVYIVKVDTEKGGRTERVKF